MTPLSVKILKTFNRPLLVEPDSIKTVAKGDSIVSISFAGCYCIIILHPDESVTMAHLYPTNANPLEIKKGDRVIQFYHKDLDPLPIDGKQVAYNNRNFDGNFIGVQDGKVKIFNLIIL